MDELDKKFKHLDNVFYRMWIRFLVWIPVPFNLNKQDSLCTQIFFWQYATEELLRSYGWIKEDRMAQNATQGEVR